MNIEKSYKDEFEDKMCNKVKLKEGKAKDKNFRVKGDWGDHSTKLTIEDPKSKPPLNFLDTWCKGVVFIRKKKRNYII